MKKISFFLFFLSPLFLVAQKKPLDHSVYDGWQSIGERVISNDGKWILYTVTPQEGDADLYIQSADAKFKKQIPRGYNALITEDNRFAIFRIRAPYKDTRDARIKKKRPEDFPKDSFGIVELGKDAVFKVGKVRSFKTPDKAFGWVAYQKERDATPARGGSGATQKTVDSLRKTIDSLVLLVTQLKNTKGGNADAVEDFFADEPAGPVIEGSDLVLRQLPGGKEKVFRNVVDYYFNRMGQKLVMRVASASKDSFSARAVVLYDLQKSRLDTILKGANDFRSFSFSEDGNKLAFLAERDTSRKALQRFYELYYYRTGFDSATMLVSKHTAGMAVGTTVSENGNLSFSKSGNRLFFGTAAIQPAKDTSLIDIDLARLDIWNYKDDYLQTQQLFQLNNELRRNYLAVYDLNDQKMQQLGSRGLPTVLQTNEGDGNTFVGITDTGRRVESQWMGSTKKDIYAIDLKTGKRTLVKKNHSGNTYVSSTGKYILLYDNKAKNYFTWNGAGLKNISSGIQLPLYDELADTPDDPNPYGVMGWSANDSAVFIYDRYDVWKLDPAGVKKPVLITQGRKSMNVYRYLRLDPEERFIPSDREWYFRVQNQKDKKGGLAVMGSGGKMSELITPARYFISGIEMSQQPRGIFILSKENYEQSPDLYIGEVTPVYDLSDATKISQFNWTDRKVSGLNPQQAQYNWGTAELYQWKAFDGKPGTGILYKPEDFDSTKKYPMLIYFYEKLSDGLYNYVAPTPTPSRLNISFFVSRGYLVFTPDISYTIGHPAKSAYNYIVSGAQALAKKKWVDAKNIGIQGQSWGGIQVAQLVTMTKMFKAAWAGAPVANMFSAYGGIRWESGNNRQAQYEHGQSRIGATPWEHPELYIESSPLFHLRNVTTPLVIMSNDADGAVPWYQGIELFTAMRRLNKPVWMLSYNGEAHNLVERRNRKDIQIREQQYFDWLLKGDKPPKWIVDGVPAVNKGRDWGLELVDGGKGEF